MSCPTCDCKDWSPVTSAADSGRATPLGARVLAAVGALFGRRSAGGGRRQCLRCGRIYGGSAAHAHADDHDDEAAIAERMSRIESKMSEFGASVSGGLSLPPVDGLGLEMRPKEERKCLSCGHFALVPPSPEAACPRCGKLYEKVERIAREKDREEALARAARRKA